ncbi:MAG: SGNH/GDSL hydrolase N-terminal domain-containing protein [Bacteroidota bacterium]
MKFKLILLVSSVIFLSTPVFSQNKAEYKWWNPAETNFPVLEGQAWPKEVKSFYDRLPARAEQAVRPDVWNLSKHSAGLYLKFNSNSG